MLAEKIGGSSENFVEMMNKTAGRLGMTNTHFVNPNGLPVFNPDGNTEAPEQAVTTARDMALLANMILKEFPQYAGIFALTEVRIGKRLITTHNGLLKSYDGADGMKRASVCAAGYNVVASATRNHGSLWPWCWAKVGAARTVRAAGLFEHGFEIYPCEGRAGPTLATWPVKTAEDAKVSRSSQHRLQWPQAAKIASKDAEKKGERPALEPGTACPPRQAREGQ